MERYEKINVILIWILVCLLSIMMISYKFDWIWIVVIFTIIGIVETKDLIKSYKED